MAGASRAGLSSVCGDREGRHAAEAAEDGGGAQRQAAQGEGLPAARLYERLGEAVGLRAVPKKGLGHTWRAYRVNRAEDILEV